MNYKDFAKKTSEGKNLQDLIDEAKRLDEAREKKTKSRQQKKEEEALAILEYESRTPEIKPEPQKFKQLEHNPDKEWDVTLQDKIEYFDPTLSYELTGYRPITKTEGLDFNPKLFTQAADSYRQNKRYTMYAPGTFRNKQFWTEEWNRCVNGYTVGKYRLTGENYFWLNYYRLQSNISDETGEEAQVEDFPGFLNKQYEYFHYLEMVKKLKKDGLAFKARGVGASEIAASNTVYTYTFHPKTISLITAYLEDYVRKTLSKCWKQLNFLNTQTDGEFRHVRMKIDTDMHKRASKVDRDKNESGWMSEIEGIVHDLPRKLRGDRVNAIYFEECFAPDTKVIMSDYSRKRIEDIKVGDFVMGIDGTPQEVIKTNSGNDNLCLVKQLKGEDYIVTSNHKLYLEHRPRVGNQKDKIELLTPLDYFQLSDYNKRTTYGLKSAGLQFNQSLEDLDPYFLGAWLGDGDKTKISIIINETADPEIREYVLKYYNNNLGQDHHITIKQDTKCKLGLTQCNLRHYSFSGNVQGPNQNKLLKVFKKYNLIDNKHIPQEVYYTPIEYRLKVLAGLIDTDGNLSKGSSSYSFSYEIAMSREPLINEIAELARSCGFYVHQNYRKMPNGYKKGSDSYRICIRGDLNRIPVLVARKKLPIDYKRTSNPLSTSIKIENYGYGRYCGITLKSYGKSTDNLFLLNDYTIAHNCGSDPVLEKTYTQSEALVKTGGKRMGSRYAFGCVCAGTKVWTGDGRKINIEDLTQQDTIIGYKNGHANIEPITYIQPEAYKECVRITFKNDTILECSEDHPILTRVPRSKRVDNGRIWWYDWKFVPAKDVMKYTHSNCVAMCDKIDIFGSDKLEDPYLIGALIGDGSYGHDKTPKLSNCDQEILNYVKSKYSYKVERSHVTADGRLYEEVRLRKITQLLRACGIYGQTKTAKRLPINYMTLTKWDSAQLLAGLFDTDGYVRKDAPIIVFTQSSREILEQVQVLLEKFGVYSTITKNLPNIKEERKDKNPWFNLIIHETRSFSNFRDSIPLKIQYKRDALNKQYPLENKHVQPQGFRELYIKSIESIGVKRIYNLTANDSHTYLANNIITHNTGGDSGPALEALNKMFYNPEAYKILPYKNYYTQDGSVQYTGFFIPAYTMWFGDDEGNKGFDERGVVNEDLAKAHFIKEFSSIVDPKLLLMTKAEFCFTPEDAFILEGTNRFDQELLIDQYNALTLHKTIEPPKSIRLSWNIDKEQGTADKSSKPRIEFITDGPLKIAELPMEDPTGHAYSNLYVAGIDAIDTDSSTSTGQTDVSNFCMVVMRRAFGTQPPKVVAIYKERPTHIQTAFENALKLCTLYNCKVLVEATRISIKQYFEKEHKLDFLMRRPQSTANSTKKTNFKQYGVPATEAIIQHQLDLIEQFIVDYSDQIQFPEMLQELMKYSYENKRKFDIVAAFGICLLADEDMIGKVAKVSNYAVKKISFGYTKNEYGQIGWDYEKVNNYGSFKEENIESNGVRISAQLYQPYRSGTQRGSLYP